MNRPFVVLIAGGTASGKTSLANAMEQRGGALLISHDRYYRDQPDASDYDDNYDRPEALDSHLLVDDLGRLLAGHEIELPRYDFATHRRLPQTDRAAARALVVVEGILVLAVPALRALADLTVFVHADADLRLARRLLRDVAERGMEVGGILHQYLATVRPMHLAHVEPSRVHAQLTLDGEAPLDASLDALVQAIRAAGGPIVSLQP